MSPHKLHERLAQAGARKNCCPPTAQGPLRNVALVREQERGEFDPLGDPRSRIEHLLSGKKLLVGNGAHRPALSLRFLMAASTFAFWLVCFTAFALSFAGRV